MAKKGSSMGKILLYFGIFLIVIVGAGFGLRAAGVIGGAEEGTAVETEKAKLKTITQLVSASGKIQPEVEVIIRPDVSGEIIELAVNEGDFVRKGDLLVRLKPDIFKARIDELNAALLTQKARLEQTRASLIQAEAAHLKNKELYEKDIISELDFIQTKSNYDSQKASLKASEYQVQSAEAQLRKAEEELKQTVIRAPQDGTVTGLAVEFGERVLGNSQMAGTEMMRVSLLDKMEVLVEVNENDIVNISSLDTTRIEVDAYPERRFNGIVTEIANSARITGAGSNEQVTNYQVKVRIITPHNLSMSGAELVQSETAENPEENFSPNFKPGMSATVDIETKTAKNVVSVPIQAVTVRDFAKDKKDRKNNSEDDSTNSEEESSEELDNNLIIKKEDIRKVVFIVENGIAVRYEVETGISDNTHTQILSGVNAGDEIVIGSYRTLSKNLENGDKVKVENNSDSFASIN
ncbi:MAG: efflux RND transporter periplasmic adaptor subunit [Balneola sp.]|nr:efflux RND transporter periplasmic adaptor subunit [Balneola sp.]MBO6650362.1 efflux RND transporter periplasmic adaptor subunit [Balneola sp.]MBO6710241.1 efflux RND transporter periplasmic adaptor subunit [Balneola sp.]MBO6798926.1 efflux RND transporter periplasmic adaptor subunit [Balneola sp.]MBO6870040.1 efflux RND transporter periplasmic adaptor subunit [Balneola sp.]